MRSTLLFARVLAFGSLAVVALLAPITFNGPESAVTINDAGASCVLCDTSPNDICDQNDGTGTGSNYVQDAIRSQQPC